MSALEFSRTVKVRPQPPQQLTVSADAGERDALAARFEREGRGVVGEEAGAHEPGGGRAALGAAHRLGARLDADDLAARAGEVQREAADAAVEVPDAGGLRLGDPVARLRVERRGDGRVRLEEAARAQAELDVDAGVGKTMGVPLLRATVGDVLEPPVAGSRLRGDCPPAVVVHTRQVWPSSSTRSCSVGVWTDSRTGCNESRAPPDFSADGVSSHRVVIASPRPLVLADQIGT